mgnify:CR=1 FL=1
MTNPFFQPALDLVQKRDAWDRLTRARGWVLEYYDPRSIKLEASTNNAAGCGGYHEAMSIMVQAMSLTKPSKENMLAWIDARLKELRQ